MEKFTKTRTSFENLLSEQQKIQQSQQSQPRRPLKPALPPKPKLSLTETTSKLLLNNQINTINHFKNIQNSNDLKDSTMNTGSKSDNFNKTTSSTAELETADSNSLELKLGNYNNIINSLKEKIKNRNVLTNCTNVIELTKKPIEISNRMNDINNNDDKQQQTAEVGSLLDEIYAEIEEKHIKTSNLTRNDDLNVQFSKAKPIQNTSNPNVNNFSNSTKNNSNSQFCSSSVCSSYNSSSSSHSHSCSCSSSSSSSCSNYAASNISSNPKENKNPPPLPSVPPPPLMSSNVSSQLASFSSASCSSSDFHSASSSNSRAKLSSVEINDANLVEPFNQSMSLEEEIELEIRSKLNKEFLLKKVDTPSEADEANKNARIEANENDVNNRTSNYNDSNDDEETDYLEPILLAESKQTQNISLNASTVSASSTKASPAPKATLNDKNMGKILNSFNNNPPTFILNQTRTVSMNYSSPNAYQSVETYASTSPVSTHSSSSTTFSLSPSKLKSYLLKANSSKNSQSISKDTSQKSVSPSPTTSSATTTSSSHNRTSLSYLFNASNKITSTLRLIRTRSSTHSQIIPASVEVMPYKPSGADSPCKCSPNLAKNELNSSINSRSKNYECSPLKTNNSSFASSTNLNANNYIRISRPTLISQTFDLSKQNLIEIKPDANEVVSSCSTKARNEDDGSSVSLSSDSSASTSSLETSTKQSDDSNDDSFNEGSIATSSNSNKTECFNLTSRSLKDALKNLKTSPTIVSDTLITNVYEEDGNSKTKKL